MMATSPKFASTATVHPNSQIYLSRVLDYSTLALDLRKRSRSPSPEGARHQIFVPQKFFKTIDTATNVQETETVSCDAIKFEVSSPLEQPSTTTCYSSPRALSESDTSDISSTDPVRDIINSSQQSNKSLRPRPFKAFPKDPLSIVAGVATAESLLGKDSSEAYAEFRKHMLAQVQATHGVINKNMRRSSHPNSVHNDDPNYWEKRRKNNEAAKRSRDARRAKEDEIAIRCAFLEQENLKLRFEVTALRNETDRLRTMIYH